MSSIKEKQRSLQASIGESPVVHIESFTNWGLNQKRDQVLAVRPTCLEEVQAVIRAARKHRLRVRAAGTRHSWSPVFSDEGNVVLYTRDVRNPDGHNITLDKQLGDGTSLVTVMAGTTTGEFKEFELENDVVLHSSAILPVFEMGGLVSMACHGAGYDCRTISDYVMSMRIVDSDGNLRTFSVDEDEELMNAARVSLGLFGIIYQITFKVYASANARTTTDCHTMGSLFYDGQNLKRIVEGNWYTEIFWFPFNSLNLFETMRAAIKDRVDCNEWNPKEDHSVCMFINKTEQPGELKTGHYYKSESIKQFLQFNALMDASDDVIVSNPDMTPFWCNFAHEAIKRHFAEPVAQKLPHAIHYLLETPEPVLCMEFVFDVSPGFKNVCDAVQIVMNLTQSLAAKGQFPLNMSVEMRFTKDSEPYLSPGACADPKQGGSGQVCWLEVAILANTTGWQEFLMSLGAKWMTIPGARPHWGKQWAFLPNIEDHIRKVYGKRIESFWAAHQRANVDPDGMFLNSTLQNLLLPNPSGRVVNYTQDLSQHQHGGNGRKEEKVPPEGATNEEDQSCVCAVL